MTTQLSLPIAGGRRSTPPPLPAPAPAPAADPAARLTAAAIVWRGAGRPEVPDVVSVPPGPCWWCGLPTDGRARPLSALADTFPSAHLAAAPGSRWLCRPCGWTICDHVRLPPAYARARIALCADQGRRCQVAVGDAAPERRLLLRLADGRVGLWTPGPNAAAEEPWTAAAAHLRVDPRDVGPCRYLGAVDLDTLGDGPAKFRAFHHLATPTRWVACTDSDRALLRAWLLDPPGEPWAGIIGDGKKHAAIYARPSAPAGAGLSTAYYRGDTLDYDPATLARQVAAWEALVAAGASDDDIASGRYRGGGGVALVLARRIHDPTIAPLRGGPAAGLVAYLRRNRKELACVD